MCLLKEIRSVQSNISLKTFALIRTIRNETGEEFSNIHILFGDSPAGSLKVALKNSGRSKTEKVIAFWDKFSIGPIWQLHEEKGVNARLDWMKNVTNDENEDFHYKKEFRKSVNQINTIQDAVPIIIWIADNSHEQTGLRYVLHLLKNKDNDIMVINTTKKHSELFNEKDIEYTVFHTGEILLKNFKLCMNIMKIKIL